MGVRMSQKYWYENYLHSKIEFTKITEFNGVRNEYKISLWDHLQERSNFVIEAIQIAQKNNAMLSLC
jgi:hypothetical protein